MNILVKGSPTYANPFREYGNIVYSKNTTNDIDLIVFTGGTDVNPELYGEKRHHTTGFPDKARDTEETLLFQYGLSKSIPMVGICRGAQFLNVMNGGRLFQDVDNHCRPHLIHTRDYGPVQVNSTHHQMMMLSPLQNYTLLGWAEGIAKKYDVGPDAPKAHMKLKPNGVMIEPEIVWFPRTLSLAVQYHPEIMSQASEGWKLFQNLIKEYLL